MAAATAKEKESREAADEAVAKHSDVAEWKAVTVAEADKAKRAKATAVEALEKAIAATDG